jgi:hypothetical protein
VTYSRRKFARRPCSRDPQTNCDERLLAALRELGRQLDPLPEHAAAAARSAFSAVASDPESSSQHPRCQSIVTLINGRCTAPVGDQVNDIVPLA